MKIAIFYILLHFISICLKMLKIKKTVSLLLLALYMAYYVGAHCFFHTHNLSNGVITHSHPYTSGTHTHNANDFQLINIFTNTLFVGATAIFFLALFPISTRRIYSFYKQHTYHSLIGSNLLRAPPVA